MDKSDWYETVRQGTLRLVNIRSVSPGEGEKRVAQEVVTLLQAGNIGQIYTECGFDPVQNDAYGRQNAYAFLRGQSNVTLVLLGHIDTVDTKDYGTLEKWALDPKGLTAMTEVVERLLLRSPVGGSEDHIFSDWLFGRGVADMKGGVAVNIALMRRLALLARSGKLPISVVMIATVDEENESAGVLQAARFLVHLREQYDLNYMGVLNTDYSTARYPADTHRYIYAGTGGKLLPSFLCIGRESHAGDPFKGIDANLIAAELIRDLSMNDELCDNVRGQVTAPPVTLHATDLKTHYDVQLPFATYFYLNVMTFSTGPDELMERLCERVRQLLQQVLDRVEATELRWLRSGGEQFPEGLLPGAKRACVLTYADLYQSTVQHIGLGRVTAELEAVAARLPVEIDKRERSMHLVYRLWTLSGRQGPAVVLFYAPPFYPHVAATPGPLYDAIKAVMAAHPEVNLEMREFYPYLSDLSYLRLEDNLNIDTLKANMPLWSDGTGEHEQPGSYSLPLEVIKQLQLPVFNWGMHGHGVHQRDEGVLMSYSFEQLPQLLFETIMQLGKQVAQER